MKLQHGTGHSIRFYLAMSYTLFVLVGLTVVGMIWFARQEIAADDALLLQMKERARLMASISQFETLSFHSLETPEVITALNRTLRVLYMDPSLNIQRLSDLSITPDQRKLALELAGSAVKNGYTVTLKADPDQLGGYEMLYSAAPVYSPDGSVVGVVCLILPLDEFKTTMNQLRLELIGLATLLALVGLALGYGLASMFTRPIKRAGQMAALVARGEYNTRLPLQGPDELVALSEDLNRMAADLQSQADLRSQMLANVSHELARPLGGLRLGIDTLQSGAIQDPELAEDLLNEISNTMARMTTILEDLELAAHAHKNGIQLHLRPLKVEEVVQSIRSRFWLVAESRSIQMTCDLPAPLASILGDETRVHQIIGNLVDNALKFTPSGGEVMITARNAGSSVEIEVSDTGIGIPPGDLQHVFEPFYQGSNSQMIHRGMGLGLSIVNRLVIAHHGRLELANRNPHGTTARVWLPSAPDGQVDRL